MSKIKNGTAARSRVPKKLTGLNKLSVRLIAAQTKEQKMPSQGIFLWDFHTPPGHRRRAPLERRCGAPEKHSFLGCRLGGRLRGL